MAATGTAIAPQVRSIAVLPLRIGFSWSLAGWVGYAACQWLMLSVLAKFGSPTIVGQFAFALALSAPIFMFTNLNLRGVQSTDALREYCFPDYVTLRLIGSAVALLAIISICPFLKLTHSALLIVLLVALFKSLESFGDVIAGLMQKYEMLDSAAIAVLLRGGLSILLFAVTFVLWRDLPLALLVWLVCAGAVIANYDFRVARRLAAHEGGASLRFSWRQLQGLALTSLPLGFVSAIGSFNTNIPRYMIQHVLSVSELGIFASIAYPVTAATIIANSLGQSALARLSRLFAEGRIREFKHLVLKLISVGAGLGILAVTLVLTCGNRLLTLLYTPEYAKQGSLFVLLATTAGLNCVGCFLMYALTAARKFKIQFPISLACMLATFCGAIFFVPRFRLIGAALALLCSASLLITATGMALAHEISQSKQQGITSNAI
ncbi:MAG TPA: hypothetical protein VFA74_14570 [Terriglobales bacterium]|nr:hypothetical protein [Terriglobales bacterium]